MTKLEALKELAAKVEAGQCRPREIEDTAFNVWTERQNGHPRWYFASSAMKAYYGSLDAAKALHEVVLPTGMWAWQLWTDHNGVPTAVIDGFAFSTPEVTADNPARAWLLAILNALIAMEEANA